MIEEWKKILCKNSSCLKESFDGKGRVKEKRKIFPNIDNDLVTQFTCPHCGQSETWGVSKRKAQEIFYFWLKEKEYLCHDN